MITVKKVFEQGETSVYQAYENSVLGETIVKNDTIVSEQTAPVKGSEFYRDFMLRSVVFVLSEQYPRVKIAFKDDYFKTLGFQEDDCGMSQDSDKIVFPSSCCSHDKK